MLIYRKNELNVIVDNHFQRKVNQDCKQKLPQ